MFNVKQNFYLLHREVVENKKIAWPPNQNDVFVGPRDSELEMTREGTKKLYEI